MVAEHRLSEEAEQTSEVAGQHAGTEHDETHTRRGAVPVGRGISALRDVDR